jgi:hypothetical protein
VTDPYAVSILTYGDQLNATVGGHFSRSTRVRIMVGAYGPFSNDFPVGSNSPDQINAWIQQQVANVMSVAKV